MLEVAMGHLWDIRDTRQAVLIAKTSERLSNLDYQMALGVSKRSASRDLEDCSGRAIGEDRNKPNLRAQPQRARKGLKGLIIGVCTPRSFF